VTGNLIASAKRLTLLRRQVERHVAFAGGSDKNAAARTNAETSRGCKTSAGLACWA